MNDKELSYYYGGLLSYIENKLHLDKNYHKKLRQFTREIQKLYESRTSVPTGVTGELKKYIDEYNKLI